MEISIVIPVYNDWPSLKILLRNISFHLKEINTNINVFIINDSSSIESDEFDKLDNIHITIINLTINVGHQRAIAIGLCFVSELITKPDYVIIMDSDGEDNPVDILALIKVAKECQDPKIVFARRSKRSERFTFRLSYLLYTIIFFLLTGKKIKFGNFSCIPFSFLPKITHNSDFWNHYSGSIIKSKIPFTSVPTIRGKRYSGESKMNFSNLVVHALSSFSLYMDIVILKILKISIITLFLVILFIPIILYIKFFTDFAIPGWATFIMAIIINILITVSAFTFLVIIQHLNNRSQKPSYPIEFYKKLIFSIKKYQ